MSRTPTAVVTSKKGHAYQQEITAGQHKIIADVSITVGGSDQGMTPHEGFIGELGACTAMTMQMRAQKRNWDLKSVTIRLYEDKVDDPNNPGQKIPRITEEIEVEGNLSAAELKGLEAAAKMCPVYKLLVEPKVVETSLTHKQPAASAAPSASGGSTAAAQQPAPQPGSGSSK